ARDNSNLEYDSANVVYGSKAWDTITVRKIEEGKVTDTWEIIIDCNNKTALDHVTDKMRNIPENSSDDRLYEKVCSYHPDENGHLRDKDGFLRHGNNADAVP